MTRVVQTVLMFLMLLPGSRAVAAEPPKDDESQKIPASFEWFQFDKARGVAILIGNIRMTPPNSEYLIAADAGIVWIARKEAYLEGNIRIYKTLGKPVEPSHFDVPRPSPTNRTGLEPGESIEKAGDLDDLLDARAKKEILIDTRVPFSEAERVYINWADAKEDKEHGGTVYLVKPTLRMSEAGRIANWVVSAPSAEGIAAYQVPILDENGKETGKKETRRHFVVNNATFTTCTFKEPHTSFTATSADFVQGDFLAMRNVLFQMGDIPLFYFPSIYADLEYEWPRLNVVAGHSSHFGTFVDVMLRMALNKNIEVKPRFVWMSARGEGYGLDADYHFGHEKEIRGSLESFWIPTDKGTDFLADTSRKKSGWPAGWPPILGPLPNDIPLGTTDRYRFKFVHMQEYPKDWEFHLEIQKFSDAGVYREYFEKEFDTEKPPETQAILKWGRNNWAVFVRVKTQTNEFLTDTEYLPQIGFNWIAQPLGWGFLFNHHSELANVRTQFADTRQRFGQSDLDITQVWLRRNEYTRPPALTLRENDTDGLRGWRFDTINTISRSFNVSIFNIEPYVGWRTTWFEHGISGLRGSYAGSPPPLPLPVDVAVAPDETGGQWRNQVLAGARIATEFHRVYDVSDRPILSRFFPNGMRHIVTPEIFYTYESEPTVKPTRLPENDSVTEQNGLHKITFALWNRWQTKWAPVIERDPRAPVGGEWYRRKLAAEEARDTMPVDVVALDMDLDLFMSPGRSYIDTDAQGRRIRRLSNFRTTLFLFPTRKTTFFLETVNQLEGGNGSSGFDVISAGVKYDPRPGLSMSLSNSYHFRDASVVRFGLGWDIDPKWSIHLDIQQSLSGSGSSDKAIELTRRFHEWQVTFGYQIDQSRGDRLVSIRVGPSLAPVYRPSWAFLPRSIDTFQVAETAR